MFCTVMNVIFYRREYFESIIFLFLGSRIAVRKDTCRLDVITLDVKERISAFIWSKEVLPFDCVRALVIYFALS